MSEPTCLETEFVVVGSGPGGAVTACTLAEAGRDVLIVEEGARLEVDPNTEFSSEQVSRKYRNGGLTLLFGSPKIIYAEGRVLGGGSEINSGLYHRTPRHVLEKWSRDFGVRGLLDESFQRFFENCENALSIGTPSLPASLASLKFRQGAEKIGLKPVEVQRSFVSKAGGEMDRRSMSRTFLPRALASGAKIKTETKVLSFVRSSGKWEIQAVHRGGRLRIICKHLVLAAGAIQTPALLRKSGFVKNVGNTLQIHPMLKVLAEFPTDVAEARMGVGNCQAQGTFPGVTLGCSISSKPYIASAILEYESALVKLNHCSRMANYYVAVEDTGHGKIRNLPGFSDPWVRHAMSAGGFTALNHGIRELSHLLFEAGAKTLFPAISGMRPIGSLKEMDGPISRKNMQLLTLHLFSSCPMGENREFCAADSYGRVFGTDNLYIADASMLCTSPGVNPQGTIMAFSARNAEEWLR